MNDIYNQPTDRPGHPDESDFGAQVEDRARWLLANEPHAVLVDLYEHPEQGLRDDIDAEIVRIAVGGGSPHSSSDTRWIDADTDAAEGIREVMRAAAERLALEQLEAQRND